MSNEVKSYMVAIPPGKGEAEAREIVQTAINHGCDITGVRENLTSSFGRDYDPPFPNWLFPLIHRNELPANSVGIEVDENGSVKIL